MKEQMQKSVAKIVVSIAFSTLIGYLVKMDKRVINNIDANWPQKHSTFS